MTNEIEPTRPDRIPDAKSHWLAVISIVLGTFMVVVSEILPVGLLTDVSKYFQVSEGTVGWMITAPGIAATFSALVLSMFIGRTDRRVIFCVLSLLMLVSNILIVIAPNFTWVIFARLISGICVGGFWTFSFAAARSLVVPHLADRATALILAAVSAATVLGVPIGSYLGSTIGWQSAFIALAALAAIALLIQWICLPSLPAQNTIRPSLMWAVVSTKQARLALWFIGIVITGHFAAQTYLKPLLEENGSFSANHITLLLLAYGLAGFVGTYIAERAAKNYLRGLLSTACLSMGAGLLLIIQPEVSLVALAIIVWGVAYGIIPVGIQIWMYRSVPELLESSSALIVVMFQIAIALGALIGGVVVDGISLHAAMILGAALAGCALVLTAQLRH